jgi:hypothetical protein
VLALASQLLFVADFGHQGGNASRPRVGADRNPLRGTRCLRMQPLSRIGGTREEASQYSPGRGHEIITLRADVGVINAQLSSALWGEGNLKSRIRGVREIEFLRTKIESET